MFSPGAHRMCQPATRTLLEAGGPWRAAEAWLRGGVPLWPGDSFGWLQRSLRSHLHTFTSLMAVAVTHLIVTWSSVGYHSCVHHAKTDCITPDWSQANCGVCLLWQNCSLSWKQMPVQGLGSEHVLAAVVVHVGQSRTSSLTRSVD